MIEVNGQFENLVKGLALVTVVEKKRDTASKAANVTIAEILHNSHRPFIIGGLSPSPSHRWGSTVSCIAKVVIIFEIAIYYL